jgi:hypothetical protein
MILREELSKLGTVTMLESGYYTFEDVMKVKGALTYIAHKSMKRQEFEQSSERRKYVQVFLERLKENSRLTLQSTKLYKCLVRQSEEHSAKMDVIK